MTGRQSNAPRRFRDSGARLYVALSDIFFLFFWRRRFYIRYKVFRVKFKPSGFQEGLQHRIRERATTYRVSAPVLCRCYCPSVHTFEVSGNNPYLDKEGRRPRKGGCRPSVKSLSCKYPAGFRTRASNPPDTPDRCRRCAPPRPKANASDNRI